MNALLWGAILSMKVGLGKKEEMGKYPAMIKASGVILAAVLWTGIIQAAGTVPDRTVVTIFYPLQIAMLNLVAGIEGVRVVNLAAPAAGCLHDYQPTPGDWATLAKADLLVANGAGLESAILGAVTRRFPDLPVVEASAGIPLLVAGGVTNAHVWVSPARHMRQVASLATSLAVWDPAHARDYRRNADLYLGKLEALQHQLKGDLACLATRDIITFHEAFAYFAADFGLTVVAVVEREPGSAPAAGELAGLVRRIREAGARAIFAEPQYPGQPASVLARETGARVYLLDPVVAGPPDPDAYLQAMRRNGAELRRALGPREAGGGLTPVP